MLSSISKEELEATINERPVEELWEELAKLSAHVVHDNVLTKEASDVYPLSVRQMQLTSARALVDAIDLRNKTIEKERLSSK